MGRKWQAWKTSFQQKKTTASGTNILKWTWFLQREKPSALSPSPRWHITLNCYPDQRPFIQNVSCAELCDKLYIHQISWLSGLWDKHYFHLILVLLIFVFVIYFFLQYNTYSVVFVFGLYICVCMCLCVCIYIYMFRFFSIIGYYKIFSIVPCAIQ